MCVPIPTAVALLILLALVNKGLKDHKTLKVGKIPTALTELIEAWNNIVTPVTSSLFNPNCLTTNFTAKVASHWIGDKNIVKC